MVLQRLAVNGAKTFKSSPAKSGRPPAAGAGGAAATRTEATRTAPAEAIAALGFTKVSPLQWRLRPFITPSDYSAVSWARAPQ